LADFHDALVALAVPATGSGNPYFEAVGIIEDGPATDKIKFAPSVVKRGHGGTDLKV
jgi:hypothetical protein